MDTPKPVRKPAAPGPPPGRGGGGPPAPPGANGRADADRHSASWVNRADKLGDVVQTLCMKGWGWQKVDANKRKAIQACLDTIGAIGVVTRIRGEDVTISHFSPRSGLRPDAAARVTDRVEREFRNQRQVELLEQNIPCRCEAEGLLLAALTIPPLPKVPDELLKARDYCVLVYKADGDPHHPIKVGVEDYNARSALGLIYQVIRQRVRMFAPFPGRVSERYWDDSFGSSADRRAPLLPPWEREWKADEMDAATLSYDLRKSTFCMENADSDIKFADWLDLLVQILTRVSHLHGGVFDKFTGDGALVHFLQKECHVVYGTEPVEAALACAIDMQYVTRIHLERLRSFLRLDSNLLGGAIGLDVAPVRWSLDHRGNPITVGRAVVGACRLGDNTKAGKIRLTNIAYRKLDDDFKRGLDLRSVEFTSKEYDRAMELTAWELNTLPRPLASNLTDYESFCRDIYDRHEQRKELTLVEERAGARTKGGAGRPAPAG